MTLLRIVIPLYLLFEHDLFGKPVPTFPDHALRRGRASSALLQHHLRLRDDGHELALLGLQPRLPDLGAPAAMHRGRGGDDRHSSLAPPMKLVLLSIVVVPLASSGKLIMVAAAPTESA